MTLHRQLFTSLQDGSRTLRIRLILPAVRTDIFSKSTLMRQRHACVCERRIDDSIKYT